MDKKYLGIPETGRFCALEEKGVLLGADPAVRLELIILQVDIQQIECIHTNCNPTAGIKR